MSGTSDVPVVAFASQAEWETWLASEHGRSGGVWLKIAKKGAASPSVTYQEALDVALCYGWIDGQKAKLDAEHWLQRFTPRRPGSKWSRINRDRVEQLLALGQVKPAGVREVERAKSSGAWEAAYDGQRTATVPEDFQQALDAHDAARAFFGQLSGVNRYAILYRIQDAKKPETRVRRIQQFVAMLAEGRTLHS